MLLVHLLSTSSYSTVTMLALEDADIHAVSACVTKLRRLDGTNTHTEIQTRLLQTRALSASAA